MKIIILLLAILGVNPCFASAMAASESTIVTNSEELGITELYRRSLPYLALKADVDLTATAKAEAILEYLQLMGGGDTLTGDSRASYLSSLETSITKEEPIQMVILGFPFKSGNLTKVLSPSFDMGDYLGLLRLEHTAYAIEKAVGVKCDVHIINQEPYLDEVFSVVANDLGLRLIDPREYQTSFLQLIRTFPHLHLGEDLTRLYDEAMKKDRATHTAATYKAILENTHLKPLFMAELENSALTATLYAKLEAKDIKSKAQKEKYLKTLRDQMVLAYELGVNVFRDVVKVTYGSMLRLSVHGDESKIGINFASTPGTEAKHSCVPWHGTLLCTVAESGKVSFDLTQVSKIKGARKVSETISGIELSYMLVKE